MDDFLKKIDNANDMCIKIMKYHDFLYSLNNCNNCGNKECEHRPKLGEIVRFNCFAWKSKE